MSFKEFEDFIPEITDTVIEASDEDIVRCIQRAMRKIAFDTEYFFADYVVNIVAGQTEYTIYPQYDAKNYRVKSIELQGNGVNNNLYSLSQDGNTVTLVNIPPENITGGLEIKTALLPRLDCTVLDREQLDAWPEAVISLTKYLLHKQPNKPWSNSMEAQIQEEEYDSIVELMSQDRFANGQSGAQTIQFGGFI